MDYRLVEYCFALPAGLKIRGTTTKWLLRRSLRGIVPDAILDRKDKVGFATPFASWIRGALREPLMDVFDSRRAREHGVFDVAVLKKVLDRHMKGRLDMSYYIWRWLTTELWLSQLDEVRAVPQVSPAHPLFPGAPVPQCVSQ
jgi:asparagine synthase (glutamine-hydrolysing)